MSVHTTSWKRGIVAKRDEKSVSFFRMAFGLLTTNEHKFKPNFRRQSLHQIFIRMSIAAVQYICQKNGCDGFARLWIAVLCCSLLCIVFWFVLFCFACLFACLFYIYVNSLVALPTTTTTPTLNKPFHCNSIASAVCCLHSIIRIWASSHVYHK